MEYSGTNLLMLQLGLLRGGRLVLVRLTDSCKRLMDSSQAANLSASTESIELRRAAEGGADDLCLACHGAGSLYLVE